MTVDNKNSSTGCQIQATGPELGVKLASQGIRVSEVFLSLPKD
jgi:hypothetical protein